MSSRRVTGYTGDTLYVGYIKTNGFGYVGVTPLRFFRRILSWFRSDHELEVRVPGENRRIYARFGGDSREIEP